MLGIGFALKRYMRPSNDFFLAGSSIPARVCGLAFISANLGAQEVIGMGASGAKYGIVTSHFYWIGAVPAMVFLGVFMIPALEFLFESAINHHRHRLIISPRRLEIMVEWLEG